MFLRLTFTTLRWSCAPLHQLSESCTTNGSAALLAFLGWRLEHRIHGTRPYPLPERMITTPALGHHAVGSLLCKWTKRSRSGITSPSNCSPSSNLLNILPYGGVRLSI